MTTPTYRHRPAYIISFFKKTSKNYPIVFASSIKLYTSNKMIHGYYNMLTNAEILNQDVQPFDPPRYIDSSPASGETVVVSLDKLVTTREKPEGLLNAIKLMRAAYDGSYLRRTVSRGTYSVTSEKKIDCD